MPYVNIRVAGKLSRKQKDKIVKGVTKVIAKEAKNRKALSLYLLTRKNARTSVVAVSFLIINR